MNPSQPQQDQPPQASAEQQVVTRLKEASKILVTVSNNPSVDQLAAAIGLTLVLNKLKKHATAVFSGEVPSVIEFLQPEKTLEKNTDSLRDFIIALDKAKADKLRYKVEDKFVKIFITPYHTSISDKDLEFSQGDFNVEAVVALGVKKREELDQAITAHGRILHDATVISINSQPGGEIGNINFVSPNASSLSEIAVGLCQSVKGNETDHLFDPQTATAFLTGIVAETDRFSNEKTSPQTMTIASVLMKSGANQKLIADKLDEPEPIPEQVPSQNKAEPPIPKPVEVKKVQPPPPPKKDDGSLTISHNETPPPIDRLPEPEKVIEEDEIHIDEEGTLLRLEEMRLKQEREAAQAKAKIAAENIHGRFMAAPPDDSEPPLSDMLPESQGPGSSTSPEDGINTPPSPQENKIPLLSHDSKVEPQHEETIRAATDQAGSNKDQQTASAAENEAPSENNSEIIEAARQQVNSIAGSGDTTRFSPIAALNAQPLDLNVGPDPNPPAEPEKPEPESPVPAPAPTPASQAPPVPPPFIQPPNPDSAL